MTRLYLVRNGRVLAGSGAAADPGLDEVGRVQAEAVVNRLGDLARMKILTSPLLRARETAAPLAAYWRAKPIVEHAVVEIPSPSADPAERIRWLKEFMAGVWSEAPFELRRWRDSVVAALAGQKENAVVFSHFVAINAAVGAAKGDDRVAAFRPDNGSITVLDVADGKLILIERGREASTRVM